mmetsp:Transcript_11497/g.10163  ORF Transcript_11497/g.10163 Transcript_11497/m.10163 type:complete len:107 (+) Transcript_11497:78-398(+)
MARKISFEDMVRASDYPIILKNINDIDPKENFGPHIEEDGVVKQKEYDSIVYSTPNFDSNHIISFKSLEKTRNISDIECLEGKDSFEKVPNNTLKIPLFSMASELS